MQDNKHHEAPSAPAPQAPQQPGAPYPYSQAPQQPSPTSPYSQPPQGPNPSFPYYQQSPQGSGPSFPYYQTPPPKKPRRVFCAADRTFVWLSILMGYLLIAALPLSKTPLGSMLALMLLYAFGGLYLHLGGIRPSVRSGISAVILALFSLTLITTGNGTIRFFSWSGAILGFLFFLADASGLCGRGLLSNNLLTYARNAIFVSPAAGVCLFFPALKAGREEGKANPAARMLGWIALGLLMALIPTVIVVALLSYDEEFTRLLSTIFKKINLWRVIRDLILGFGVAILLFGALYSNRAKGAKKEQNEEKRSTYRLGVLPRPLLCAAVTPILLVYALFFFSQRSYYLSALTHVLPGDLTYAEYARQGFFELCWVCGINAVLLLLFNLFIARKEGGRNLLKRIYSALISVFTLILITTALSKMILYIDSYGLTPKRVYTSWFMCLLAFLFLIVLLRQIFSRFPLIPTAVIGALLLWAVIAFPNTDAIIARYNVDAYLQGELQEVDVVALLDLEASAVPALTDLEKALSYRTDLTEKEQRTLEVSRVALLQIRARVYEREGFFSFNLPDARAKRCFEELKERTYDPINDWFD